MKKICRFCSLLLTGLMTLIAGSSLLLAADNSADTLPPARSGECYAKVSVPPVYKIEEFDVIVKQDSEDITVTPAVFETVTESIVVREGYWLLDPIPAEYETVTEQVQIADAEVAWMRQAGDNEWPASKGLLSDLIAAGVDTDNVDIDSCYFEHVLQAEYEEESLQVMIAEATERLDVVPAEFATVAKQILRKPAYQELEAFPAEFVASTEDVIVEAAHSVWKPGRGPIERIDNSTGEIMCRVDVPAVYESVDTQVIDVAAGVRATRVPAVFDAIDVQTVVADAAEVRESVPAQYTTVRKLKKANDVSFSWLPSVSEDDAAGVFTGTTVCRRELPARYETVERQVLKTPASFKKIEVPPEYADIEVEKLVSRASEQRSPIAARTKPMIRRVKVSDARLEWRPVLCETNMSDDIVKSIQEALNERGYNAGKVDGVLGRGTMRAIERYQEDKNLPLGGLTYSTLESLGIETLKN